MLWEKKNFLITLNMTIAVPDSPLYLEVREEEETLKKVVLHSVATALASIVLPVPKEVFV